MVAYIAFTPLQAVFSFFVVAGIVIVALVLALRPGREKRGGDEGNGFIGAKCQDDSAK